MFESLLTNLGLSAKETRVYEALLTEGQANIPTLVKKTGEKRGVVHFLLNSLAKKGLIIRKGSGKEAYFEVASPYKLEDLVREKTEEVASLQKNLANALPNLVSQYHLATNKPTIRYFEGKDGLKEVFADIYAPTKEVVWGAADIDRIEKEFPGFLAKSLIPKRVGGKLHSKAILSESAYTKRLKAKDLEQNRESKLISPSKYPLPAEIDVYENKIAALSFAKNNFVGLIIENEDIATSLKSIFRLAFDSLK